MTRWSIEIRRRPSPDGLANDLRSALKHRPVSLPPKWFYDDKGSQLFDAITELEEYYPTRTETAILEQHARDLPAASTLIELGAGYSRKTRLLLEALTVEGRHLLFVPVDVAEAPLRDAAARICADFPTVSVRALVDDFEHDLTPLPGEPGDRLVAFLGSTIGNLLPGPRAEFLGRLHGAMAPGDRLLLGADLVKDPTRLVAAYDDRAGVTAAFNKNLLEVLARELGADIDPDTFEHVARYDEELERIEMRLRSRQAQTIAIRDLDLQWHLEAGEEVLTETSAKFRVHGLRHELSTAGFAVEHAWTDPAGDYSVVLARRQ